MHNYEVGDPGGAAQNDSYQYSEGPHRNSTLSLVLLIIAVAVGAIVVLGLAFIALGVLFHLAGFLIRLALVVAVVAFVWRMVTRGRNHRHHY